MSADRTTATPDDADADDADADDADADDAGAEDAEAEGADAEGARADDPDADDARADDAATTAAPADADVDDLSRADADALLAELEGVAYDSPAAKVQACTRQLRDAYPQGAHAGLGVKDGIGDDAGVAVTVSDDGRFVTVVHTYKEVTPDRLLAVVDATDCAVVGTDTNYQSDLETTENAVWIAPEDDADDVTDAELDERFDDWATTDGLDRYPEWAYADAIGPLKRRLAVVGAAFVAYLATGYPVFAGWVSTEPLRTLLQGASVVAMAGVVLATIWCCPVSLRAARAWSER